MPVFALMTLDGAGKWVAVLRPRQLDTGLEQSERGGSGDHLWSTLDGLVHEESIDQMVVEQCLSELQFLLRLLALKVRPSTLQLELVLGCERIVPMSSGRLSSQPKRQPETRAVDCHPGWLSSQLLLPLTSVEL